MPNRDAIIFSNVDDFLAWEAKQPTKHEFVDGVAVDLSGGTLDHAQIAGNILFEISTALRGVGSSCRVLGSNVMVRTMLSAMQSRSRYADIVVTCDSLDDGRKRIVERPKLIVEVLSESTAEIDLRDKADEYRAIPTLEEYLLVDSRTVWFRLYRRVDGSFVEIPVNDPIVLTSVDVTLAWSAIYRLTTHYEEPTP